LLMSESKIVRKGVIVTLKKLKSKASLPATYLQALEVLVKTEKEKQLLEQNNLLLEANNQELEIELDEHKAWFSVKRVCLLGHFKTSQAKSLWRNLKTYSIANDYKIVSIFDANYGSVKTYHKDVWKAVYMIEL
jgi:hypothetical protein